MVIVRALKDVISIKFKTRHDSFCDQFSRVFMTKIFLMASVIMGFDYFSDKVTCMTPKGSTLSKDFIHSVCWISGFYIYEEMKDRLDESSYFGIPLRIKRNGIDSLGRLCETRDQNRIYKSCHPMTKLYYLQYQWLPFYVGALAVLYYLPYIIFRLVNSDLVSLKRAVKSFTTDADNIVQNYFNYRINPIQKLRFRVWLNILVKVLYVVVTVSSFLSTDYLLLGNFVGYGKSYINWGHFNVTMAHNKARNRITPKPGNILFSQ
ncbi:uncharacterized protein LOC130625129 [Hydractinia symbiolongicarpus]|uniref:uncharacterized protein LOC130625129 n=1 Tax=Hydractinia symbiolongicarpus TaxID=13093 RepID=UPI00254EC18B|nr:uncharacterized protein LOC130625129 [Hydractinia symbiolongicarpus]